MKIVVFILMSVLIFADSNDINIRILHIPKDLTCLDLNIKQKALLKVILKQHREKLRELHELEEKFEYELKKSYIKESFDKESFIKNSLQIKKSALMIEVEFFEKLHTILDKRQRKKFIDHIEEWEVE